MGRKNKRPHYDRKSVHTIEETFAILDNGTSKMVEFNGEMIKRRSLRYDVFRQSLTCSRCGCEGHFFALERSWGSDNGQYHLNLYSLVDGKERLMTKDHIVPKSEIKNIHFANQLINLETMCSRCNSKKGNKSPIYLVDSREVVYNININK